MRALISVLLLATAASRMVQLERQLAQTSWTAGAMVGLPAASCCEPQQYKCCQTNADCCSNWGKLECSAGVCVFPGATGNNTASRRAAVAASEPLHELIFAIPQLNLDVIRQTLEEVSTPGSASYGKHLTWDQVGSLVSNPHSLAAVQGWISTGAPAAACNATPHHEYLSCTAPISSWNHLLSAQFREYSRGGMVVHRATTVSVPEEMEQHLAGVFLAVDLPVSMEVSTYGSRTAAEEAARIRKEAAVSLSDPYCDTHGCSTPSTLHKVYNISSSKGETMKGSQSVFETGGQYMSAADLAAFQKKYGVPDQKIAKDFGGNVDDDTCKFLGYECGEANLDIQYITAIGQGVPSWFWSTDKTTFDHWLTSVAATKDGPLVHSVSYGQPESQTLASGITAFDNEAMKLGVQGISILVSTGDDGVAGPAARSSTGLCGYKPQWPATSPFVTAVGATQGPEEGKPEVVCETPKNNNTFITSGGGFSASIPTPKWQADQVAAYLANKGAAFGPGFNAKGRGYPDVSLIGHLYPILVGGEVNIKDGTSASTPVMAAILSLVNHARLSAGKSSVGFANPALYGWAGDAGIFNDITDGANNCCAGGWKGDTVTCCSAQGFHAVKGWDAATGLGSVNAGNLIAAWMTL